VPTFAVFIKSDLAQSNLLSYLSTMLVEKKAHDLMITAHWLQQYGLVHAPKLTDFIKHTAQNQSRRHSFPLWSEFLAPTRESDPMLRVEERATIEATYPTLVPLIFGSDDAPVLADSEEDDDPPPSPLDTPPTE
jgi:hypothetical protein